MPDVLSVRQLRKHYGDTVAVDGSAGGLSEEGADET
jgi:hypothetical protein